MMDPTTYFFFSSRRRHTRFSRDWSSDVCSSDLFPSGIGDGRRFSPQCIVIGEPEIAAAIPPGAQDHPGLALLGDHLPGASLETQRDPALRALVNTGQKDRKSTRLNSSHVKISYA